MPFYMSKSFTQITVILARGKCAAAPKMHCVLIETGPLKNAAKTCWIYIYRTNKRANQEEMEILLKLYKTLPI